MGNLWEKTISKIFKPDVIISVTLTVLFTVVIGFNACSPPTPERSGNYKEIGALFQTLTESASIGCSCKNAKAKGVFAFYDDCARLCANTPSNGYTHAVFEVYAPYGTLDQFCRASGDNGPIPQGCIADISSPSRNGSMQVYISGFNGFQNIISFQVPSVYETETNAAFNFTELVYNQTVPAGEVDLAAELNGYKPGNEELFVYVCHQLAGNPEYIPDEHGVYPDFNANNKATWPRVRHGEPYALFTSTAFSKSLNCNGINKDPFHSSAAYVINTFNTPNGIQMQNIGYGSGVMKTGTLLEGDQQNPEGDGVNLLLPDYKTSLGGGTLGMHLHRANNPYPFLPMNLLSSINGATIEYRRVGTVLKAQKLETGIYSCDFARDLILDGQNLHHVLFRIMQNQKNTNEYMLQPLWTTRWGTPSSSASGQGIYSGRTYSQIMNNKDPLYVPWRSDTGGTTNKEFREHTPGSYYCAIDKVQ
jgi:hypothetical protein